MSTMLLTMAVAALGFVTVAGFGMALVGAGDNDRLVKRAQGLAGGALETGRGRVRRDSNDPSVRRKQMLASLKEADRNQRKATLSLTSKLNQAGLKVDQRLFWICSGVLGVLVSALSLLLGAPLLLGLGLGFGMGLGAPRWVLGFLGQRRLKRFTAEFANAIDIIVRGIKSGLPVHDCLKIIARESPEPLGGEFTRLVENLGMGMTLEQSLERAYERMPTSELRFFTIVLSIQQKSGGNLAEALGNLSNVLRSRKMMREKIKALSSEATASAMIIGALPPAVMLILLLMAPAYMMKLFVDPRGHMVLAAGFLWMSFGVFVMRRMINFKF